MDIELNNNIVSRDVIEALNNLRDDEEDPDVRWVEIDLDVDRLNAVFITGFLHGILRSAGTITRTTRTTRNLTENSNSTSSYSPRRTTGLYLRFDRWSNGAVDVFCDFLQHTNDLTTLSLDFPNRQVLNALHHNDSVKNLRLHELFDNMEEDDEEEDDDRPNSWVAELLRNRTDFEGLCFEKCNLRILRFLPFVRHGLANLRELRFIGCRLDDDGIESIIQALIDGNHHELLEDLDFRDNFITPGGLRSICALVPSTFSLLKTLLLCGNRHLLDDPEINKIFVRQLLMSPQPALKELRIAGCCSRDNNNNNHHQPPFGYSSIIKALESSDCLLPLLEIGDEIAPGDDGGERGRENSIRSLLVESLPKMNSLQHLICDAELTDQNGDDDDDQRELLMTAFHRNTSLLQISNRDEDPTTWTALLPVTVPHLLNILKRNKDLAHVDGLLSSSSTDVVPTAHTGATRNNDSSMGDAAAAAAAAAAAVASIQRVRRPIPQGLWPRVLALVGRNDSPLGATPVYKILRDRLATWPETIVDKKKKNSNKRKRHDVVMQENSTLE